MSQRAGTLHADVDLFTEQAASSRRASPPHMTLTPSHKTAGLSLHRPDATCAAAYERFFTDGSASDGYGGAPLSADGARARLAKDREAWERQGFGLWAIHDHGAPIGACGFAQKPGWPRELTWWLLPAFRGRGIAFAASQAALAHAYDHFRWPTVETYMKDSNRAARALALRLGGVPIDRPVFPDGIARDRFRLPPPPAGAFIPIQP